jgi:hypothetical protein
MADTACEAKCRKEAAILRIKATNCTALPDWFL